MLVLSPKQRETIRNVGRTRHTFTSGPWRSGKSFGVIRGHVIWLCANHSDQNFILLFKTWKQLRSIARREIRGLLLSYGLRDKVDFNLGGNDEWWVKGPLGVNTLLPIPFGDSDIAVERLQGLSACGAIIDEGVNLSDETRNMVISRVSETDNRSMGWTTNPSYADHPFKVFMDTVVGQGRGRMFQYGLYDNPNMDAELVHDLELACPLDWQRRRYINGEWCGPSGGVWPNALLPYPNGSIRKIGDETVLHVVAGVDYGSKTTTAVVFLAVTAEGLWVVDEWMWEAADRGRITEPVQAQMMMEYAERHGLDVTDWVVDPTAPALKHALQERGAHAINVVGNVTVNDTIEIVARGFNTDRIFIDPANTAGLRRQIGLYEIPEDAGDYYHTPKPDKAKAEGAHLVDGFRYACWKMRSAL